MKFMEKLTENQILELSQFVLDKNRTLEEIKRAQGIILLHENYAEKSILMLTGLKRSTLIKARKKFIKHGLEALKSKRKIKKPKSLLTKNQRLEITHMLNNKTPKDYGWEEDDVWTSFILGKVILELYDVQYKSKTSLYLIFKQSKFSFHKPEKLYEKRDQAAIDEWKIKNEPIVQQAFLDPETVLLVEDEMILTNQTTLQKAWLPTGKSAYVESANTRSRKSFYGFLNIKTGKEKAVMTDKQNGETSVSVLKEVLADYADKKVILFWDNAPWHRSEEVKEYLRTCSNLRLINFPSYAPEENPQEHVWKAARANITHNTFMKNIKDASESFLKYLNETEFKYKFFGLSA